MNGAGENPASSVARSASDQADLFGAFSPSCWAGVRKSATWQVRRNRVAMLMRTPTLMSKDVRGRPRRRKLVRTVASDQTRIVSTFMWTIGLRFFEGLRGVSATTRTSGCGRDKGASSSLDHRALPHGGVKRIGRHYCQELMSMSFFQSMSSGSGWSTLLQDWAPTRGVTSGVITRTMETTTSLKGDVEARWITHP